MSIYRLRVKSDGRKIKNTHWQQITRGNMLGDTLYMHGGLRWTVNPVRGRRRILGLY